ncbi:MAG: hypothetical protein IJ424_03820 [Oscillospiraceae bacterium]|nr:hypothetical protein [Oscillospiraceae bacterium]
MNWLKNLSLGICALSVIYTIIKLLAPQKYHSQIKMVLSLLFAILLGSMILGFDISDITDSFTSISSSGNISQEDRLVILEIESRLSEYLKTELENAGINPKKVTVKTNIDDNLCISISEARVVLVGNDETKIERIKLLVAQKIGDIDVIIEFSEE